MSNKQLIRQAGLNGYGWFFRTLRHQVRPHCTSLKAQSGFTGKQIRKRVKRAKNAQRRAGLHSGYVKVGGKRVPSTIQ